MATTPFRQIVRRVPLRGGGKTLRKSAVTIIPEYWHFVPPAKRSQSVHSGQTPSPSVYINASCTDAILHPRCTAVISIPAAVQFRSRAGKSLHHIQSIYLFCRARARDAGRHPPAQRPQTRRSHYCACDSSPFAGEQVGHVRRKKSYDPLAVIGEKTQSKERCLLMAVQMNTTPGILFITKFHVAFQIHQPSISILLTVSSQPWAVVRNEFTHFGLLWPERLSTHRPSCRPNTANVGGRQGTLRKDLTNCSQDAILR